MDPRRRRFVKLGILVLAVVVWLVVYIDDWGRDFSTYEASISTDGHDPTLRALIVARSADQMVAAVKMAARRIPNWTEIGEVGSEGTTLVAFVRTHRLLRVRDDITIRVEDLGDRRVIRGESRSRLHIGDLGRNPRNLRRFLSELRTVLDGAAGYPVLLHPEAAQNQAPPGS